MVRIRVNNWDSKKYLSAKKGKDRRHSPTSRQLGMDEDNLSVIERRWSSVERSILLRASLRKCKKLRELDPVLNFKQKTFLCM
jgi:hypothetical protein